MNKIVNEAHSREFLKAKQILKNSKDLGARGNYIIGAVGSNELEDILTSSLKASEELLAFVYSVVSQSPDYLTVPGISSALTYCKQAEKRFADLEKKKDAQKESVEIDTTDLFIDPYEAEYMPAEMLTASVKREISESVTEDLPLPDDLDDDPDALSTLDKEGMPVKFNNTPIDLDPFAVKMFRNNAELIDPPEVFDTVSDANKTVEPDIEPGAATDATVDDSDREQFIDVVADAPVEGEEEKEKSVELPSDDFDVFANESKSIPTVKVTPKEVTAPILPPQFSQTEAKRANESIAENPGNNLKMLAFLAKDW